MLTSTWSQFLLATGGGSTIGNSSYGGNRAARAAGSATDLSSFLLGSLGAIRAPLARAHALSRRRPVSCSTHEATQGASARLPPPGGSWAIRAFNVKPSTAPALVSGAGQGSTATDNSSAQPTSALRPNSPSSGLTAQEDRLRQCQEGGRSRALAQAREHGRAALGGRVPGWPAAALGTQESAGSPTADRHGPRNRSDCLEQHQRPHPQRRLSVVAVAVEALFREQQGSSCGPTGMCHLPPSPLDGAVCTSMLHLHGKEAAKEGGATKQPLLAGYRVSPPACLLAFLVAFWLGTLLHAALCRALRTLCASCWMDKRGCA
jgi:hypothetical protein